MVLGQKNWIRDQVFPEKKEKLNYSLSVFADFVKFFTIINTIVGRSPETYDRDKAARKTRGEAARD